MKVGYKGVYITWTCFPDESLLNSVEFKPSKSDIDMSMRDLRFKIGEKTLLPFLIFS